MNFRLIETCWDCAKIVRVENPEYGSTSELLAGAVEVPHVEVLRCDACAMGWSANLPSVETCHATVCCENASTDARFMLSE
jgi:hypothetical protein